jgi:glycosyltransferase involved in cell wall biosynthesis
MLAILYIICFGCVLGCFYLGWYLNDRITKKSKHENYNLSQISVLIPFRNEASNIPHLLTAIKQLTHLPLEFIWVNDHSEDASLDNLKNLPTNHQLLHLPKNKTGKKAAIRAGIANTKGSYILTWDADIKVPKTYFEHLQKTPISALSIFPVCMQANTIWEVFYELDYYFLSSINVAVSGFTKPIVASGANLLFEKESFLACDSIQQHQHIASGDDQFLLDDFKKAGKSMQVIPIHGLCVTTETPHSLKSFLQQRLRWIGKSSKIKDTTTYFISGLGIVYLVLFIFLLFTPFWFYVLPAKIMVDFLIFLPYLHRLNRKKITWFLPIFTCIYPIYFLIIVLFKLGLKTQWKGRSVDSF